MGIRIELPPELANRDASTRCSCSASDLAAPRRRRRPSSRRCSTRSATRAASRSSRPGRRRTTRPRRAPGFSRGDRDAGAAFESVPASRKKGSDGALAARLLGSTARCSRGSKAPRGTDDLDARQLQTALWPATGGYYLDQIMASPEGQPAAFSRRAARRRRAATSSTSSASSGPLPTLRAGRQPYGLLPAMSLELFAAATGRGRFVAEPPLPARRLAAALAGVPRLAPAAAGRARRDPAAPAVVGRLPAAPRDGRAVLRADARVLERAERAPPEPRACSCASGCSRATPQRPRRARSASSTSSRRTAPSTSRRRSSRRGEEQPGRRSTPNYISFLRTASFDDLLDERLPAGFPPRRRRRAPLPAAAALGAARVRDDARRILIRKGRLPNEPLPRARARRHRRRARCRTPTLDAAARRDDRRDAAARSSTR